MSNSSDYISTLKDLRDTIGNPIASIEAKKLNHFEKHSLFYLAHASLLAITSPAFTVPILLVSVKDSELSIHNESEFSVTISAPPKQSVVAEREQVTKPCGIYTLVAGYEESLRLNGTVSLKIVGEEKIQLTITLTEHYFHCAKSIKRANFWKPETTVVNSEEVSGLDEARFNNSDVQDFIRSAPFLLLATQDAEGNMDLSPRGDPDGFLRVLEEGKVLMPERPGNKIADSLTNLLANPAVALILFKPGDNKTLVIAGDGKLTRSKAQLEPSAVKGKTPAIAIEIDVKDCFYGENPGLVNMDLWNKNNFVDRSEMPSLGTIVSEQLTEANKMPGGKGKLGRMLGKITGAAGDVVINLDYKKLY